MRLTKQTNYAIRMLMYCASTDTGSLSRVQEIAKAYGVSELFLFKILQPLVEAGLMETVRGRKGGVRLGKPAADITLYEVVRVTEENFAMAECFENDAAKAVRRGHADSGLDDDIVVKTSIAADHERLAFKAALHIEYGLHEGLDIARLLKDGDLFAQARGARLLVVERDGGNRLNHEEALGF